jgi:HEAT repeat protein
VIGTLLALAATTQDVEDLLRRLRAEEIDVRERAVAALALADDDGTALERAGRDPDPEIADRARAALARRALVRAVRPAVDAAFPGLRARLADGRRDALPGVLVEALRHPALTRDDLQPLARPALDAATDDQRPDVLGAIALRRLDAAAPAFAALLAEGVRGPLLDAIAACRVHALEPELLRRLRSDAPDRWRFALPLARLGRRDLLPDLAAEILTPTDDDSLRHIVPALLALDAAEAFPALFRRLLDVDTPPDEILRALRILAPDPLLAALHDALRHPRFDVRRRALVVLADRLGSPSAVPALRAALTDPAYLTRAYAADALGRFRRAEAVDDLLKALKDDAPDVRRAAALALTELGRPEGRAETLARLADAPPDPDLVRRLAALGVQETRPVIIALLKTDDRLSAITSLARLDKLQALPTLRTLLKDPAFDVRMTALSRMHQLGHVDEALDDLRAWTRDEVPERSLQALFLLCVLRPTEGLPNLRRHLEGKVSLTLYFAIEAVGLLRDVEAAPAIKALLNHPSPDVREGAARALARLTDDDVRRAWRARKMSGPPLVGTCHALLAQLGLAVEGPDTLEVRTVEVEGRDFFSVVRDSLPGEAEFAEGRVRLLNEREARGLPPRPRVPPIVDNPATRAFQATRDPALAAAALREAVTPAEMFDVLDAVIKSRMPGCDVEPFLKHPAPLVRTTAARAVLTFDGAAGVPRVVPLLDDPHADVRTELVRTLGRLERREANREILARGDDPAIMWGIAQYAPELKLDGAVPILLRAARWPKEDWGRMNAVQSLRVLGDPSLIPQLREMLAVETDLSVTHYLLEALGAFGAREAVPDLLKFLNDLPPIGRHHAPSVIRILDQLGAREVEALRGLLDKPDIQVHAAEALADWGDVASLPALRKIPMASEALGVLGDRESVPLLRERLAGDNILVQRAAARGLARLGEREPIADWPEILALYRTPKAWARLAELGYEVEPTSPEYLPALRPWLSNELPGVRARAARAVGRLDGEEALELTRGMLKDPAEEVRQAAADQLHRRGVPEGAPSVPFLRNAAGRPAEWKRLRASKIETPFYGPTSELVALVAKAAGLDLEDLPADSRMSPAYRNVYARLRPSDLPLSGADVLERLPQVHWRIVLAENRLRVLPR